MNKRIIISGIGALSAHGHTIESICKASGPLSSDMRVPLINKKTNSDVSLLPVKSLDTSFLSGRLKQKLDSFVIYGLHAAEMAIAASRLLESGIDNNLVGVFVGNCLGGWHFAEPEVQKLHTLGLNALSPYLATAWFPAALQGQISLRYGFKNYSKTYSSMGTAGIQAVGYAVEAIQNGKASAIICGASEALSNPYIHTILQMYDCGQEEEQLSVFGKENVVDFEEGAAFLVIEEYEQAKARGAPIYCEITGFSDNFCTKPSDRNIIVKRNMEYCMGHQNKRNLLIMDGFFQDELTFMENDNFVEAKGSSNTSISAITSKAKFGNMFSVSGVMELACAAHDLHNGFIKASLFEGNESQITEEFKNVIIRRFNKQGGISALSLSVL